MSILPLPVRGARSGRSLWGQLIRCVETRTPFLCIAGHHSGADSPSLNAQVEVKTSVVHDGDEPALGVRRSKFDVEKQYCCDVQWILGCFRYLGARDGRQAESRSMVSCHIIGLVVYCRFLAFSLCSFCLAVYSDAFGTGCATKSKVFKRS